MTWKQMVVIEPRLAELEEISQFLDVDPTYLNYERIKKRLHSLVGWEADHPDLRSEEAWGVALHHLTDHLVP